MKKGTIIYGLVICIMMLLYGTISHAKILMIAPHPDDDILDTSGVIYDAVKRGEEVKVIFMTNGDFNGISYGNTRQLEAVNGEAYLGVAEDHLMFLGYPDGYLSVLNLNSSCTLSTDVCAPSSVTLQSVTYASHGLGLTDYHNYRFGSHANYNKYNMLVDLEDIISTFKPDHIFTQADFDKHADHNTSYSLLRESLTAVIAANPAYNPTIHKFATTYTWFTFDVWPNPVPPPPNAFDPTVYYAPVPALFANLSIQWSDRESLDVPLEMQDPNYMKNKKFLAIWSHRSQFDGIAVLLPYLHKDEFFWTEVPVGTNQPPIPNAGLDQTVSEGATVTLDGLVSHDPDSDPLTYQWAQTGGTSVGLSNPSVAGPTFTAPTGLMKNETLTFSLIVSDGTFTSVPDSVSINVTATNPYYQNLAPLATLLASSESTTTSQTATRAVDGVIDGFLGYPGDSTKEWSTNGEGAGAWLQLDWAATHTVDRVVLYDRPNLDDQILNATLLFSDGTSTQVGPLDNNGGGTEVTFPSKVITSVRMTVNTVSGSTSNVGLAEIEVYGWLTGTTAQTITVGTHAPATAAYNTQFTVAATASSGLGVAYSSGSPTICTNVGATFTMVSGTGACVVQYDQAGSATYKAATRVTDNTTAQKVAQTITFAALAAKTYGDAAFSISSAVSSGLTATYGSSNLSVATISGSLVTIISAGTTTITAYQAGDGNYNPATSVSRLLTVNKAGQTITFGALAIKVFGDPNYAPGATVSSGLTVSYTSSNTGVATIVSGNIHIVSAGTTTITASQPGDTNYNAATPVEQGLIVAANGQTITVIQHAPASAAYNSTFNVAATASSGLSVAITTSGGCSGSGSVSATILMTSGTTTCTVNYNQAGSVDFGAAPQVSETTTAQMINQATLTAVVTPAIVAYGSTAALSAAGGSGTGAVTYSAGASTGCSVASSTLSVTSVNGTCSVTATKAADTNYNAATSLAVTVTLQKAAQTITFNTPTVKDINDAPFALNATGGSSPGNAVTFVVTSGPGTIAGTTLTITGLGSIVITASQAGDSNYNAAADVQNTITVLHIGDLNSDNIVDIADALKDLRIAAGLDVPTASDLAHGDVAPLVIGIRTPDGKIDLADVVAILRKVAGLPSW